MNPSGRTYRTAVDIGGTFTDFTVMDDQGSVTLWKEDSNPDNHLAAILRGIEAVAAQLNLTSTELLAATEVFVHGSTIATNAIIERSGSRVGLLCTEGFRDVLYLRDGFKWDRFNVNLPKPEDFVPRQMRLPVTERIDFRGGVVTSLDEEDVRRAAQTLNVLGVEAVAIAFLWSVVNPAHEHRAADILREEMHNVPVVCSADVLPEMREWQRTSAAVLSAYSLPKVEAYLKDLGETLRDNGLKTPLQVMQINGGCASVAELLRRPVNALHSGPAAAPSAAMFHAARDETKDLVNIDLVNIDMGGTSFDVSLIRSGQPVTSREIQVEHQPVGVSGVEVHSIGAGGGSVAWIDPGGALRVGPQSAGARPGPACYGAGGTQPTVTDANVVLGYLDPAEFLGGRRQLRADLASDAIQTKIADPLGLDVIEAAAGIFHVANAHMIDGIRYVSVERGIDPREFALVAGGGAGSIHAARLARNLGMRKVLVPSESATFCAFGMTVTDVRHDYIRANRMLSTTLSAEAVRISITEMEKAGRERLGSEGFAEEQIEFERKVDARYLNQVHELTLPVPDGPIDEALLARLERKFHAEHREQFTYEIDGVPVEYLHWRVTAVSRAQPKDNAVADDFGGPPTMPAAVGKRVTFVPESDTMVPTDVYDYELLDPGNQVSGPSIIFSPTTTVVVNTNDVATMQPSRSLVIEVAGERTK